MMDTYIIGIGGVVGLAIVWVLVQKLWRRTFADYIADEDVLAERRSCSNCGCAGATCTNKNLNKNN